MHQAPPTCGESVQQVVARHPHVGEADGPVVNAIQPHLPHQQSVLMLSCAPLQRGLPYPTTTEVALLCDALQHSPCLPCSRSHGSPLLRTAAPARPAAAPQMHAPRGRPARRCHQGRAPGAAVRGETGRKQGLDVARVLRTVRLLAQSVQAACKMTAGERLLQVLFDQLTWFQVQDEWPHSL